MATSKAQNNFGGQETKAYLNIHTRQCSEKNLTVMIMTILRGLIVWTFVWCLYRLLLWTNVNCQWSYFTDPAIMKSPLLRIQCMKPI